MADGVSLPFWCSFEPSTAGDPLPRPEPVELIEFLPSLPTSTSFPEPLLSAWTGPEALLNPSPFVFEMLCLGVDMLGLGVDKFPRSEDPEAIDPERDLLSRGSRAPLPFGSCLKLVGAETDGRSTAGEVGL